MDKNTERQIICTAVLDTLHSLDECEDLEMILAIPDKEEIILSYGDKGICLKTEQVANEEIPRLIVSNINRKQELSLNAYQKEILRTGGKVGVIEAVMGMCEEVGEVSGKINKATFRKHNTNVEELINELGDVLWYLAMTAHNAGVPLEAVARLNFAKLQQRYPEGFDIEKSKHE